MSLSLTTTHSYPRLYHFIILYYLQMILHWLSSMLSYHVCNDNNTISCLAMIRILWPATTYFSSIGNYVCVLSPDLSSILIVLISQRAPQHVHSPYCLLWLLLLSSLLSCFVCCQPGSGYGRALLLILVVISSLSYISTGMFQPPLSGRPAG